MRSAGPLSKKTVSIFVPENARVCPSLHARARFDDVVRIVAPPPETKRTTLELDDSKPQQVR